MWSGLPRCQIGAVLLKGIDPKAQMQRPRRQTGSQAACGDSDSSSSQPVPLLHSWSRSCPLLSPVRGAQPAPGKRTPPHPLPLPPAGTHTLTPSLSTSINTSQKEPLTHSRVPPAPHSYFSGRQKGLPKSMRLPAFLEHMGRSAICVTFQILSPEHLPTNIWDRGEDAPFFLHHPYFWPHPARRLLQGGGGVGWGGRD